MRAALVIKWTTAYPGREEAAMRCGRELDDYVGRQAAAGRCTEPRWFWAPGGEHFWLVEGEYEALLGMLAGEEMQDFMARGNLLLQHFAFDVHQVGREEMFGRYEAALKEYVPA